MKERRDPEGLRPWEVSPWRRLTPQVAGRGGWGTFRFFLGNPGTLLSMVMTLYKVCAVLGHTGPWYPGSRDRSRSPRSLRASTGQMNE